MATSADIIARVRTELGDLAEDFVVPIFGSRPVLELGVRNVSTVGLTVVKQIPGQPSVVIDPSRYTLLARTGIITLLDPLPDNATVITTGSHYPLFSDGELAQFVADAERQHCHERELKVRGRNENGFITYTRTPMTLANLPDIEIVPLTILATINALYSAATDAATDMDIITAEGTHLRRGQRYEQMMMHVVQLQARYKEICTQYNIGAYRMETSQLRRISKTTGRYVPLFIGREYDEGGPNSLPTRLLPPVDSPHEDTSGVPSPWIYPYGGI
ncbi:hypothetical protein FDA94_29240 [Herbidospora galbida]|uniref:Uncharacterized protein n=1 Tax=Herbidospora galbida TaxID=2575442 RepID=A0A4U3M7A0_9ACTN|nr:hypothetical protein [Herbidospora galbida]TKK84701.1 hypothetical protein FDA94_29240 [Herbidospora galbida]